MKPKATVLKKEGSHTVSASSVSIDGCEVITVSIYHVPTDSHQMVTVTKDMADAIREALRQVS